MMRQEVIKQAVIGREDDRCAHTGQARSARGLGDTRIIQEELMFIRQ